MNIRINKRDNGCYSIIINEITFKFTVQDLAWLENEIGLILSQEIKDDEENRDPSHYIPEEYYDYNV